MFLDRNGRRLDPLLRIHPFDVSRRLAHALSPSGSNLSAAS